MAVERRRQRHSDQAPPFISTHNPVFHADRLSARRVPTVRGAGLLWFVADTHAERIELVTTRAASGFNAADLTEGRALHVDTRQAHSIAVSGVLLDGATDVTVTTDTSTVPLVVTANSYSHRFETSSDNLPRTLHFNDSTGVGHDVPIPLPARLQH